MYDNEASSGFMESVKDEVTGWWRGEWWSGNASIVSLRFDLRGKEVKT
jgi:hypothetical protein